MSVILLHITMLDTFVATMRIIHRHKCQKDGLVDCRRDRSLMVIRVNVMWDVLQQCVIGPCLSNTAHAYRGDPQSSIKHGEQEHSTNTNLNDAKLEDSVFKLRHVYIDEDYHRVTKP